jgi:hypothetical protein
MWMETLQRSEHRMTWKSAPSLSMAGLGEQGVPQEAGACPWAIGTLRRFFVESKYDWAMFL